MKTRIFWTLAMAIPSLLFADCPPPGLFAMWKGESNVWDSVMGVYAATNGTGVTYVNAEVGTGFSFDGTSNAIIDLTPPDNFIDFETNDFTVGFWIKTTNFNTSLRTEIVSKRAACVNNQSFFDIQLRTNGAISFNYGDTGVGPVGYVDMASAATVTDGVFHHVACVRQGTNASIYIDGSLSGTPQHPTDGKIANLVNDAELMVGMSPCTSSGNYVYFKGVLDEISLYDTALSASNILALAQEGTNGNSWPNFVTQPVSKSVLLNSSATFTVTAQANGAPLSYQWQHNGTDITGATGTAYTISSAQPSDLGDYTVLVSNACGAVYSDSNVGVLADPPILTTAPSNQEVLLGTNISLSATATGDGPFTYSWAFYGQDGFGWLGNHVATSNVLTIPYFTESDAGSYSLVVYSPYGATEVDFVLTAGSSHCATADSGLLAWWQGENNGLDHAGGNNATVKSAVTYTNGIVGQAFSFNATTNSVLTAGTTFGNFKTNDFTVSMWVQMQDTYANDLGYTQGTLIQKESANAWNAGNPMWEVGIWYGLPYMTQQGTTTQGGVAATDWDEMWGYTPIDDGMWHHFAFVRSGLYGILSTSTAGWTYRM